MRQKSYPVPACSKKSLLRTQYVCHWRELAWKQSTRSSTVQASLLTSDWRSRHENANELSAMEHAKYQAVRRYSEHWGLLHVAVTIIDNSRDGVVPIRSEFTWLRNDREAVSEGAGIHMSTLPLSGANSRLFSAIPLPRFSLKMSRFFAYFELEKMRSMQRQVEVRRLGNRLPVLGKGTSMLLKLCIS